MTHICLFEDETVEHLRPLVDIRPAYDLRTGMWTNLERIRHVFPDASVFLHCRDALANVSRERYNASVNRIPADLDVLFVNGRLLLNDAAVEQLKELRNGAGSRILRAGGSIAAAWVPSASIDITDGRYLSAEDFGGAAEVAVDGLAFINRIWNILDHLPQMIELDYGRAVGHYNILERPNAEVHERAVLTNPERIFTGKGVRIAAGAVLDATNGPIYIGDEASVLENAVVKGPLYLGWKSQAKVGAHLEGCAFGPRVNVNGEVQGTVIHSYSNKGHAGYLGDSYVGVWCNFGAGTNSSNLKNDYGEVSLYDAVEGDFVKTGRQFIGLIMGDHSKCGIASMFNTGTVVGTFCNLFGDGFQPRHIRSFSWGSPADGYVDYRVDKAIRVARAVAARRDIELSRAEEELLQFVADSAVD